MSIEYMSEVRLDIIDTNYAIQGTTHGSVADAAVAALSADPETIAELEAGLQRFIKPVDDHRPFASFSEGETLEPWDAGIVIVNLAARIVAAESSYSAPKAQGEIQYHDGTQATDISLLYRVPDDWVFVDSLDEYKSACDKRRAQRADTQPMDVREVLYGAAMIESLLNECQRAAQTSVWIEDATSRNRQSTIGNPESVGPQFAIDDSLSQGLISEIHARWLMTPRADLRGRAPRDVILEKLDFIDFDLHTRELQWSLLGEGPPPLLRDSHAYRFAGFGTHEYVIYYYLLRHLLTECWGRVNSDQRVGVAPEATGEPVMSNSRSALVAWLKELKEAWLNEPNDEFGRIPIAIIESERRRIPIVLSGKQMIIDENCDVCRMLAGETGEDFGPGFWHLDGCNMDEGFEFSTYRTREEWELEQRRWKEFNDEFERSWAAEHPASGFSRNPEDQ